MIRNRIRAGGLICLLVLASLAGTAGAIEPLGGTPHPHTPVTQTTYSVSFELESGDSVVTTSDGPAAVNNVTLDFGADWRFDGSVGNASVDDVILNVAGHRRNVSAVTVDDDREKVTVELETPVNASPGDRVHVHIANGTSPSITGSNTHERLTVDVFVSDPAGNVDGPARVGYSVIEAHADLKTSVVAGFETPQTLHVRGVLPNRGYVVVRAMEGSQPGDIVGVSEYVTPNHTARDIDVHLDEPLAGDTRLQLSLYRETSGNTSYDEGVDKPYRNAGTVPTRAVTAVVPDADAYATGGTVWSGQTLLYEGRPNTPYALHRVSDDGEVGERVASITATRAGVVLVNTSALTVGERYVLENQIGSGVVDLDRDGDAQVSDDAMTVATQSLSASVDDATLVLDSERDGYTARVRVDGVDADAVRAAFGDAAVSVTDGTEEIPVRVPADGRLAINATAFGSGEYDLTVTVPDTGVAATTTLTVEETATPAETATDDATATATTATTAGGSAAGNDDESDGTRTTAPLGPLVPLVALACAALLFARAHGDRNR